MKRKIFSKILAIALTLALVMSFAAITASATSSSGDNETGTVSIDKTLVLIGTDKAPNVEFNYTISNGTAVSATANTPEIFAGMLPNNNTVSKNVIFTENSTVQSNYSSTDTTLNGQHYTVGSMSITELTNPQLYSVPGIYRYVIQETAPTAPFSAVGSTTKYIDVYVQYVDDNGTDVLRPTTAILHSTDANYTYDSTEDKYVLAEDKTAEYINKYETKNVAFDKTVSGNQGDKTKFFTFTVTADNSLSNSDLFKVTLNDNATTTATLTDGYISGAALKAGVTFSLKDASDVLIEGLPTTAQLTVAENPDGYTPTIPSPTNATAAASLTTSSASATTTGTANASITFNNELEGIIPTGVLLTIAPFAIGLLLFGALAFFLISKKRRQDY